MVRFSKSANQGVVQYCFAPWILCAAHRVTPWISRLTRAKAFLFSDADDPIRALQSCL